MFIYSVSALGMLGKSLVTYITGTIPVCLQRASDIAIKYITLTLSHCIDTMLMPLQTVWDATKTGFFPSQYFS